MIHRWNAAAEELEKGAAHKLDTFGEAGAMAAGRDHGIGSLPLRNTVMSLKHRRPPRGGGALALGRFDRMTVRVDGESTD